MSYRPSLLFRSGHINTLYPALFRKQQRPSFTRIEVATEDDDIIDVDTLLKGNSKLAILCHGLEGNSDSQYIIGTSRILHSSSWDIAAMNYRGCSGRMNRQLRMYHSGATDDLMTVFQRFSPQYDEVALVGFSLGGNLVLKYLGERKVSKKICSAVAISAPIDLRAGSMNIGKKSNFLYERNFLKSLSEKVRQKKKQFPNRIDIDLLTQVKTLYDFDDLYTGPLHGFNNADDYYQKCSSRFFLDGIKIRTQIINALDDPFLPSACYPSEKHLENKNLKAFTPKYGGHVGFMMKGQQHTWVESKIKEFLEASS